MDYSGTGNNPPLQVYFYHALVKNMKNMLLIFVGVMLGISGMNLVAYFSEERTNKQMPSIAVAKDEVTVQRQNLARRKVRWEIAKKCLRALNATNGRVNELCSVTPDVHGLAKVNKLTALYLVDAKLEDLKLFEDQLNDGIISKLPDDEPGTFAARSKLLNKYIDLRIPIDSSYEKAVAALDEFKANYKPDP